MKQFFVLAFLVGAALCGRAQVTNTTLGEGDVFAADGNDAAWGKVVVHQDKTLADLTERYNRYLATRKGIPGWRVHLFFGTGYGAQQQAEKVKQQFMTNFPGIPVYVVYEAPYFKVKAGDFRGTERNLAYKLKKQVETMFPTSWIVQDMVNFPGL